MKNLKNLFLGGAKKPEHALELQGSLSARVTHNGKTRDLGVICRKKVTDAFVAYLVDSLQDSVADPMDDFKHHDSGTGVGAENKTDVALGTPCAEARDAGTQVEGASAWIYRTVAEHTYAGGFAITEHGVFSAAVAGTLMDRSVFAAINVVATDKIEFTYELTCTSEA